MNAPKWILLALAIAAVAVVAWSFATATAAPAVDASRPVRGGAAPAGGAATSLPDREDGSGRVQVAAPARDAELAVHGRVLDGQGEPLQGALVGEATSDRPVTTRGDGGFELVVPQDRRALTLLAVAAGHAPAAVEVQVPPGVRGLDAGDVQLLQGGRLSGRVVDGTGTGIAGATVELAAVAVPALPPSVDAALLLPPATTGGDGAFAFAALPPGAYRVAATAEGSQRAPSDVLTVRDRADTDAGALVLAPGHELRGIVLDPDRNPVAGAAVAVRARQPRVDAKSETAADGTFAVPALPPGALRVRVTAPGFLDVERTDVDAAHGERLVVTLERALLLEGTVVDAATGEPVTRYAVVVRRLGDTGPTGNGTIEQQLQRRIDELRRTAAAATDGAQRERQLAIAASFESRLQRLRAGAASRPLVVPADAGAPAEHAGGSFAVDGLQEGLWSVGVASPDHRYAQADPVELQRGTPAPVLTFRLQRGVAAGGVVVGAADASPVAGATVELVRVDDGALHEAAAARSLYPWVFAPGGPDGIAVMTVTTAADGAFAFRNATPGRYLVTARHARFADHASAPFDLQRDREDLRLALARRAILAGRVANVPPALAGRVSVLALGGHGTMRTVAADVGNRYRIDDLPPGSYLVRAFPTDDERYVDRLFGSLFPLHAAAVDPERVPARDVELAAGEERAFDPPLDVPATGTVQGTVAINAGPGAGARVLLRPVAGKAPGAGGQSQRGECDEAGRFTIAKVPAGTWTATVSGASRQELYSTEVDVKPGETAFVQVETQAGGLRGQVAAPGTASSADVRGVVWVLPGAMALPDDLYEYRKTHRAHRVAVRDGRFEDAALTPGPALVVVDVRGHALAAVPAVVPPGDMRTLDLVAGARQP